PQHRAARHDAQGAEHHRAADRPDGTDAARRVRETKSQGATMTSRTLAILAAALVVLALLAVYGQRRDASPPSRSGELLLPQLEASLDRVDRVRIAAAGDETVATLERGADAWTVAERHGYAADITKIRGVLRGLADAKIVEEKTSNPAYYDRLGVTDIDSSDARGVKVEAFAGDEPVVSVIVGDSAGGGQHYVRVDGEETSHAVDVELDVPRNARDWLDRTILDVPSSEIASVTIEHPDGATLRISKDDAGQTNFDVHDVPEGRELSYPGVASAFAGALRDLELDAVRPAGDDADGESADGSATTATFRTFDGLIVVATTVERDGERWVRFSADAGAPVAETKDADGADASAGADESGEAEAQAAAGADAAGADEGSARAAEDGAADEDEADAGDAAERARA